MRRTFASLLSQPLDLHAVPRNRAKPGHFDKYSLEPDGDARLTGWMHTRLLISVWVTSDPSGAVSLGDIETELIQNLDPSANIDKAPSDRSALKVGRARMAAEARISPLKRA